MNRTEAIAWTLAAYGVSASAAAVLVDLGEFVQTKLGLKVDGKVGPITRAAVASAMAPPIPEYDVEFWQEHLRGPCEEMGVPLVYALRWVQLESGGNPCAIGSPTQKGPDGHPRELGIAQFYNPDDLQFLHLTGHGLRLYCGKDNRPVRALTEAEVKEQAEATVELIDRCMIRAQGDLARVGATWKTYDVLCLTKLQHGLPGISRSGLPAVTKLLGRPPADWDEFCANVSKVTLDSGTERYRAVFDKVLANARSTASVIK